MTFAEQVPAVAVAVPALLMVERCRLVAATLARTWSIPARAAVEVDEALPVSAQHRSRYCEEGMDADSSMGSERESCLEGLLPRQRERVLSKVMVFPLLGD